MFGREGRTCLEERDKFEKKEWTSLEGKRGKGQTLKLKFTVGWWSLFSNAPSAVLFHHYFVSPFHRIKRINKAKQNRMSFSFGEVSPSLVLYAVRMFNREKLKQGRPLFSWNLGSTHWRNEQIHIWLLLINTHPATFQSTAQPLSWNWRNQSYFIFYFTSV